MNGLERHANIWLLRGAAGRGIWCPVCGHIMDWTRTAVLTFHDAEGNPAMGNVSCSPCMDKLAPSLVLGIRGARRTGTLRHWPTAEIVDGRAFTVRGTIRKRPSVACTALATLIALNNLDAASHNKVLAAQTTLPGVEQ